MIWWIVVGVIVLALVAFAFWPRRRGVVDSEVRSLRRGAHAKGQNHSNPTGPQLNGPL